MPTMILSMLLSAVSSGVHQVEAIMIKKYNAKHKDGGFIFSENKMLSFRGDAKAENLLAVCSFVRDYRI